ncbi:MAG: transposase [Vicinamibacterales bacterium]
MPDHVHVLWTGTGEDAEPLTAFARWRQWTGFTWRRQAPTPLWQDGYWDYVLRDHEESLGVAAYIVNNPVRAGLVQAASDYPFVGSSRFTLDALITAVQMRPGVRSPGL